MLDIVPGSPAVPKPKPKTKRKPTVSRPTGELPASVVKAMEHGETLDDRSSAHHHVVKACQRAGLTVEQTTEMCRDYEPSADKYGTGERLTKEVERSWAKPDAEAEAKLGSRSWAKPEAKLGSRSWAKPEAKLGSGADDDSGSLGEFTEARVAERLAHELLAGRYFWAQGLGWLEWNGQRWRECTEVGVIEAVRSYVPDWLVREVQEGCDSKRLKLLTGLQSKAKITNLAALGKGMVETRIEEFDRDPDLLNTPSGVVDLRTGELLAHDPARLITRMTSARYRPGATHRDWTAVLEALPEDVREYYLDRLGQGITGHAPPDDVLLVQYGKGENGKSTVTTAMAQALGDHECGGYANLVPRSLLLADPRAHPTDLMTLRGARIAYIEELPETHKLEVNRIKEIIGTPKITARGMRENFTTFDATHSLIVSTNYRPMVLETDHATWRRLLLVRFPYTFRKPEEEPREPTDRRGDPGLRGRVSGDPAVHEAVLAALVERARRWYDRGREMPRVPAPVTRDTDSWRADDDCVIGYFADRLVADRTAHIWSVELLTDLNEWLGSRMHNKWSDRTMATRFEAHDGLPIAMVKKKVRAESAHHGELSSRANLYDGADVPNSYTAWLGVRFRDAKDDDQQ